MGEIDRRFGGVLVHHPSKGVEDCAERRWAAKVRAIDAIVRVGWCRESEVVVCFRGQDTSFVVAVQFRVSAKVLVCVYRIGIVVP